MYCGKCGSENAESDRFCVKCGSALAGAKTAEPAPISQKPSFAGISCFFPEGCKEPVIGQCPGYEGSCLRFYCANHSYGKYCAVCAKALAQDQAIDAVFKDYLAAARRMADPMGCTGFVGFGFVFFALPYAVAKMLLPDQFHGTAAVVSLVIAVVLSSALTAWQTQARARQLATMAEDRPGFEEFYDTYRQHKRDQNMQSLLTKLMIAGAAAKAIDDYQVRQDIHKIARQ